MEVYHLSDTPGSSDDHFIVVVVVKGGDLGNVNVSIDFWVTMGD